MQTSSSTFPNDRRQGPRHNASIPAYLDTAGHRKTAVTWDVSISGALLLTRATPAVGERVRLELFLFEDADRSQPAEAEVTRVEALGPERGGSWSHQVAVRFATPIPSIEGELVATEERQSQFGWMR